MSKSTGVRLKQGDSKLLPRLIEGISPEVSFAQTEDGLKMIVTTKSGTKEVYIPKGPQGDTYVLTEQDRYAIAALFEDIRDGAIAAASRAESAKDAIEDLGVEATTLDAGEDATVTKTVDQTTGDVTMTFGIPKGPKGEQGNPAPSELVVPAVDAYLAEVITNPDSPPIDRTLSSESSAAPADMMGALSDEKNSISELVSDDATLLSNILEDKSGTASEVDYSLSGNVLTVSGTSTGNSLFAIWGSTSSDPPSWMVGGKKYAIKIKNSAPGCEIRLQCKQTSETSIHGFAPYYTESGTYIFEVPTDITVFRLSAFVASGKTVSGTVTIEISNAIDSGDLKADVSKIKTNYFAVTADDAITIPDNSDFNQYTTPGTYKVTNDTHAGTMTHIPVARAGKLVVVSLGQTARLFQNYYVSGTVGNSPVYHRFYDGTNWEDWQTFVQSSRYYELASRLDKLDKPISLLHESGSYASGKATERISIYVPATTGLLRYTMYHFEDDSNNCDGWQLYHIYHVDDTSNTNQTDLTVTGEFECAVRLDNRDDYSGGHTHGDEVMISAAFLVDGVPVELSSLSNITKCDSFKIVQTSTLYDPANGTTPIASHGKEYIFDGRKLTINQSLKWLVAESLANCFMAMFLPSKNHIDRAAANSDFEVLTLPSSTSDPLTTITKYNADSVEMWDTGSGFSASISIPVYPTGLTEGDRISISDNSGGNYNKLYFKICGGGTSKVGELWKSQTIYKLDYKE